MNRRSATSLTALFRYALAMVGPIGSAGAQFLLSLVLLRVMDQAAFGRFAFLLVASQLSWGVWGALLCAPLPILLTGADPTARERLREALMTVNLIGSVIALGLFAILALAVGGGIAGAALFACYAAVSLLRWFARAHAYATGAALRTTASDITYALILLAGVALIFARGSGSLALAWGALLAAAVAGMLPFGRHYLAAQLAWPAAAATRGYGAIWRQHSGWSLLGVVTTEATGNAQAYLVTLLLGPAAFAPVAASALMIRPINVAMNAITDLERAQMARQIAGGRITGALGAAALFRRVLVATWLATALAILLLLHFAPRLIFPPRYDLHFLEAGTALWMAVTMVRLLRMPESVLLQAAGAFRLLALASMWSSGVSVAAVLLLLLVGGPLWSIVGVLLGEVMFAVAIWRRCRTWANAAAGGAPCLG